MTRISQTFVQRFARSMWLVLLVAVSIAAEVAVTPFAELAHNQQTPGSGEAERQLFNVKVVPEHGGHLPPIIITQPQNVTVYEGQTGTFTVSAFSPDPITYQWQRNSVNIAGATAASYTTPIAVLADSGTIYRVLLTDDEMNTTTSSASILIVLPYPGTMQFTAATATIGEAAGSVALTISRAGGSSGAVSVNYSTAVGTAIAGSDYTATSGTISWADGDAVSRTITIPIINDATAEVDQAFSVNLSGVSGAITGAITTATVTITDDEAPDVTAPAPPGVPVATGSGGAAPSISGTTEIGATVAVYANATLIGSVIADGAGAWTFTIAVADGTYTITVTSTDESNNTSSASSGVVVSKVTPSGGTTFADSGGGGGGGCGMGSALTGLLMLIGFRGFRRRLANSSGV